MSAEAELGLALTSDSAPWRLAWTAALAGALAEADSPRVRRLSGTAREPTPSRLDGGVSASCVCSWLLGIRSPLAESQ